jgi:hypothetical protein
LPKPAPQLFCGVLKNGWKVKIKARCANVTRDAACASSTCDVELSTEFRSISATARCSAA